MKPTVYIESSVISYLAARPSRDVVVAARQAVTRDWWDNHRGRFELRVSQLVENEIRAGDRGAAERRMAFVLDIPRLDISDEARSVARGLISRGAVPPGSAEDALHIGISAAQGVNYLLTWNFRHINNVETALAVRGVVEQCGYRCPLLCSPEQLEGLADVSRSDS